MNDVYEWPEINEISRVPKQACVSTAISADNWHARLGHPSSKILTFLLSKHHLPVLSG